MKSQNKIKTSQECETALISNLPICKGVMVMVSAMRSVMVSAMQSVTGLNSQVSKVNLCVKCQNSKHFRAVGIYCRGPGYTLELLSELKLKHIKRERKKTEATNRSKRQNEGQRR